MQLYTLFLILNSLPQGVLSEKEMLVVKVKYTGTLPQPAPPFIVALLSHSWLNFTIPFLLLKS